MSIFKKYTEEWAVDQDAPFFVSQSLQTGIWYVRRTSDGQVFEDRETREGAILALRRRESQAVQS